MKEWQVTYYLGDMFHSEIIKAFHESTAILIFLQSLYTPDIMHDFKIKRYSPEWS